MAPSCFEVILVGFILVLPFLYETSRTFRYYFKFLVYYSIVMITAVLLLPIISLRPGNVKNFVSVAFCRPARSIDIVMLPHITRAHSLPPVHSLSLSRALRFSPQSTANTKSPPSSPLAFFLASYYRFLLFSAA